MFDVKRSIRPVRTADAAAIAAIYTPLVESTVVSFEEVPPDVGEVARRIAAVTRTHPWLVADDGGTIAGYAYATKHRERAAYRWAVDTSVYVAERYRGRGVGRALYEALFEQLRRLGYLRAFAGVALPNPASEALHRGAGFDEVGVYRAAGFKFGRWLDIRWYGISLGESDAPPEPVPFGSAH
jgi:phosphinothricin acetyltransferase